MAVAADGRHAADWFCFPVCARRRKNNKSYRASGTTVEGILGRLVGIKFSNRGFLHFAFLVGVEEARRTKGLVTQLQAIALARTYFALVRTSNNQLAIRFEVLRDLVVSVRSVSCRLRSWTILRQDISPMLFFDHYLIHVNAFRKPPFFHRYLHIVSTHLSLPHSSIFGEGPVLKPITAPPLPFFIIEFVPELHCNLFETLDLQLVKKIERG